MKVSNRIISILALSVVGASLAHANAYGYGYGLTEATYTESAPGLYFTTVSPISYSFYSNFVGSDWYGVDYYYGYTPDTAEALAYGESISGPQVGGSGYFSDLNTGSYITITNLGNYSVDLTLEVYTYAYAQSSADTYDDFGAGQGFSEFYDSDGLIIQGSDAIAADYGLGFGGNYWYSATYDGYNGFSYSSYYYGDSFPFSVYAYAYDTEYYTLSFSPGASDTFYVYAGEDHDAYSLATTPGPEAVAPFAVGLIAALRRRKKG